MSFPNMTGHQGGSWTGYPPHGHPGQPSHSPPDENGLQTRHMGLKVQYTFEKDQQNCLAKWPHVLQIQTIPIDERITIGLVDLRTCLEAIAQCSPEIVNQHDKDYAIYALEYAEEDTPWVGQGMLSWGLEQPGPNTEQKSVTGRVVKDMMAALRGGPPVTLEVRLKLNGAPRMHRPQTAHNSASYGSNAGTPPPADSNSEWSSFVQSNPNLGGSSHGPPMPSPGFPPPRYGSPIQQVPSPAPDARMDLYAPQPHQPALQRTISTPPITHRTLVPSLSGGYFEPVPASQGLGPGDSIAAPRARLAESEKPTIPKKPKRASSKAPKKKSTGNPLGRPRKRARPDAGNTSAIEDATDADEVTAKAPAKRTTKAKNATEDATDAEEAPPEGPKKERAKTTKANWPSKAPLDSAPGSLRVAASTSGSLRTMRPPASGGNGVGASHLQEIPRAPTPVPGLPQNARGNSMGQAQARRLSMAAQFDGSPRLMMSESASTGPAAQDGCSPSDSIGQSPYTAYTPDESPAEIGSSPPVPRSAHSVHSSPPLSSPVLPPMMPMPQPDSGFMSGELDEMMDDYDLPPHDQPLTSSNFSQPKTASKKKGGRPRKAVKAKAAPPPLAHAHTAPPPPQNPFSRPGSRGPMAPTFHEVMGPSSQGMGASRPQASMGSNFQGALTSELNGSMAAPPQVLQVPLEQVAMLLEQRDRENVPPQQEMVIQHEVPGDPELLPQTYNYFVRPSSARAIAKPTATTNETARQSKVANTEPDGQRRAIPDRPINLPSMQPTNMETQEADLRLMEFHSSALPAQRVEQGPQQQIEVVESTDSEALQTEALDPELQKPQATELEVEQSEVQEPPIQDREGQLVQARPSSAHQPHFQVVEEEAAQQEQANRYTSPRMSTDGSAADVLIEPVHEQRATTPAASLTVVSESPDDTASLLRLLNGPVEHFEDLEPRPSTIKTDQPSPYDINESANLEAVDSVASMAPPPASDPRVLDSSEASGPTSLDNGNSLTKNMSRKKSIKEKLERAVQAGKMPTFCSNCGSISTPTWRKIWVQDSDGSPDTTNFSDEPGRITATIVLEKDENGKPTKYRTVKKILGTAEDKSEWTEETLCNPCGLWLNKYKFHRPECKWETDCTPKTRDRGGSGKAKVRSKKRKGQDAAAALPTSEAYYTTDPIGPEDQGPSPATDGEEVILLRATTSEPPSRERGARSQKLGLDGSFDTSDCHEVVQPKDVGTAQGPAAPEADSMGQTRRLLFPSPKKDGQVKILGEVAVNIVRTSASIERLKTAIVDKDDTCMDVNAEVDRDFLATLKACGDGDDEDDMKGLFGTPSRPSTPPPKERPTGPFKTPTRTTPRHRPITRSVSKSIRKSTVKSPGHTLAHVHQTPTKTPRSSARLQNRDHLSINNTQLPHAHFAIDENFLGGMSVDFDSPFNSSLNQLLSEANDFTVGSDAHGLGDFEFPHMDSDTGLSGQLGGLDFGHFLTTDAVMPSSPPVMGRMGAHVSFEASDIDFSDWGAFDDLGDIPMDESLG